MKIQSGFKAALENPFVDATLATSSLDNLSKLFNQPDPNIERFQQAALAQGSPVNELPRGGFGKLLGMGPIQASPDALNAEKVALGRQSRSDLGMALELRRSLGPAPFKSMLAGPMGGPLSSALTNLGISPESMTAETPEETQRRLAAENQQRDYQIKLDNEHRQNLGLSDLMRHRGVEEDLNREKLARTPVPGSPESLALVEAKAAASRRGANEGDATTGLGSWSKSRFIDPETLKPYKGGGTIKTVGDARNAGYAEIVPKDYGTLTSLNTALDGLDKLDDLSAKLLPSAKTMNGAAARAAGLRTSANLWLNKTKDPEVGNFTGLIDSKGPLISAIRAIQGRYPSSVELQNAQNLVPSTMDSREVAQGKLTQLRSMLKAAFQKNSVVAPAAIGDTSVVPEEDVPPDITWSGEATP